MPVISDKGDNVSDYQEDEQRHRALIDINA